MFSTYLLIPIINTFTDFVNKFVEVCCIYAEEHNMRGERLKQRREELGLSQADLGMRLKLEGNAIYRYEKSQSDPASELLGRMAKELGVSSDWLLGLVDEKTDRLIEDALSVDEHKLLTAVRNGHIVEAMEVTLQLGKREDQSNVAGVKPAPNR